MLFTSGAVALPSTIAVAAGGGEYIARSQASGILDGERVSPGVRVVMASTFIAPSDAKALVGGAARPPV